VDTADDSGPLTLLYVGRLVNGKGLFDLLSALESLSDVELLIAGEGPLSDDLAAAIDGRNLSASLLGYRDDVPVLMREADVLVLPSYREGTPRVITEALASGLPVVSTDIAGIPEQVRHDETGLLVDPGDVDALVAALKTLKDSNRREAFGARAPGTVEQFSLETAATKYRQLYRDLLAETRPDG
jgi:glycosyltransferase involved in cell wall biosynthesis